MPMDKPESAIEFVERMVREWANHGDVHESDWPQLIALARRGAKMQLVGHLDNVETAVLRAAMTLKINERQFLAAVDREGDHEVGAGKLPDDPLPPAGETE